MSCEPKARESPLKSPSSKRGTRRETEGVGYRCGRSKEGFTTPDTVGSVPTDVVRTRSGQPTSSVRTRVCVHVRGVSLQRLIRPLRGSLRVVVTVGSRYPGEVRCRSGVR